MSETTELSRVDQIIYIEAQADKLEEDVNSLRWQAAELIWQELDSGKSQRQLASEIGKSATHVNHMAKTWRVCLGKHPLPPFNEAYHSPEVRGMPKPRAGSSGYGQPSDPGTDANQLGIGPDYYPPSSENNDAKPDQGNKPESESKNESGSNLPVGEVVDELRCAL